MVFHVKQLLQVSVFYKNDTPEGFGVTLAHEFFEDNTAAVQAMLDVAQCTIKHYEALETEAERQACIRDTWTQLEELRQQFADAKLAGTEMPQFATIFALALDDLSFLQHVGELPNDDFNGPMWCWEEEAT